MGTPNLEELKSKLAEVEARRAEANRSRSATREVEEVERQLALATALESAEIEHGPLGRKLAIVEAKAADGSLLGSVIVRIASPSAFAKFKRELASAKPGDLDAVSERLWRPLVVFPTLAEVDRLAGELPFLPSALADAVIRLCGVRTEEQSPKY